MTTYIVTGAFGHVGSTVVTDLLAQNKKVRALVLQNEKPSISPSAFSKAEIFTGDISDIGSLESIFDAEGEITVIHTAGIVSIENKVNPKLLSVNVEGTKNIVEMCLRRNAKLVYVSSVHAIPEGKKGEIVAETTDISPKKVSGGYAKSKAMATRAVLDAMQKGLKANIVFPSGIIGPFDSGRNHLVSLLRDFLTGKLRAVVRGGYDIVDVRDVASACIKAADSPVTGETFILSNEYCEIKSVCDYASRLTGVKPIKTVLPMWFAYMFTPIFELYYKMRKARPLYTAYSLSVVQSGSRFDHSKAANILGFKPRPLAESIADTINWLMSHCKLTPPGRLVKASTKV